MGLDYLMLKYIHDFLPGRRLLVVPVFVVMAKWAPRWDRQQDEVEKCQKVPCALKDPFA